MKNIGFLFVFLLVQIQLSFAQKQSNVWYFGRDGAGLDFNCIPPSVITGHTMIGWEGVATVSDPNTGKVLFYTNGDRIYGQNNIEIIDGNNITPTSAGFEPLNTVGQVMPIPFPGNPNQYFVVATDIQGGKISSFNTELNGVWAVQIDMEQNNGLGAVIDRFQIHNPLFATEKLMAVPHANGNDYFLVGHDFDSDRFFISEVNNAGIQIPPSFQNLGATHSSNPNDFDNFNAIGELKASPDGSMLASVISGAGTIELFDFDNSTGTISNARVLGNENEAFGVSFSPDNSKLYITTWTGKLIQFDLSSGNTNSIINSKTTIFEYSGGSFASLKIGPDFKIYVSRFQGGGFAQDGGDTFLGVINDPNQPAANVDYVHDGIDLLGNKCNWGLNNVIEQNLYEQIELEVDLGEDLVGECDDPPFTLNAANDCAEYLWQDGSMESTFLVSEPGTYYVDVIYGNCEVSDTMIYEVNSNLEISLGGNRTICSGESIVLDVESNEATYLWQDGSTESNYIVTTPGSYAVTVTSECGMASDQIEVSAGGINPAVNEIKIPNVFTPDGDGLNDEFKPIIPEEILAEIYDAEMIIFNRWGQKVFSTKDLSVGWSGVQNDKQASSDVFVWILRANLTTCDGAAIQIFEKGDVTVIR